MTSSRILSSPLDEMLLWLSDEPFIGMNEEDRIALRARLRQEAHRLELEKQKPEPGPKELETMRQKLTGWLLSSARAGSAAPKLSCGFNCLDLMAVANCSHPTAWRAIRHWLDTREIAVCGHSSPRMAQFRFVGPESAQ